MNFAKCRGEPVKILATEWFLLSISQGLFKANHQSRLLHDALKTCERGCECKRLVSPIVDARASFPLVTANACCDLIKQSPTMGLPNLMGPRGGIIGNVKLRHFRQIL